MWIGHIIHLSIDGHLGGFHFFVIMNNAAENIHLQVFVRYTSMFFSLLGMCLGIEFVGHRVNSILTILRNCQTLL